MAISFVQSVNGNTGVGGTGGAGYVNSYTFSFAPAAGNFAVLTLATSSATANAITSVTDNKGNTWNKVLDIKTTKNLSVWWAGAVAGGITGVTFKSASTVYIASAYTCREYSGVTSVSAVDVFTTAADSGFVQPHAVGPTAATAAVGELLIHAFASGADAGTPITTVTPQSGYSNLITQYGGTSTAISIITESKVTVATGAQSATLTTSTFDKGDSALIAFKVAPLVLGKPTNLSGNVGNNFVELTWTAAPNAASYDIYRGTVAGQSGSYIGSTTSLTYNDTTVTNGTTYYYIITALPVAGATPSYNTSAQSPGLTPVASSGPAQGTTGIKTSVVGTLSNGLGRNNTPDFTIVFDEDFQQLVTEGNFSTVYGAAGRTTRWDRYPSYYPTTYGKNSGNGDHQGGDANISVISGVAGADGNAMRLSLRKGADGIFLGATPEPLFANGSKNFTFGKTEIRYKGDKVFGPYLAWLIWNYFNDVGPGDPRYIPWPQCGEPDFLEGRLDQTSANVFFHRYGGTQSNSQDIYNLGAPIGSGNTWHVVGFEWSPKRFAFYMDGQLKGVSTGSSVSSDPHRMALQSETDPAGASAQPAINTVANMYIDYVTIWSYTGYLKVNDPKITFGASATLTGGASSVPLSGTTGVKLSTVADLKVVNSANAVIAFVQSVTGGSGANYVTSANLVINATYGNTLILAVTSSATESGTIPYISDSRSNTWTNVADIVGTKNLSVWVTSNVAAGPTTIIIPSGGSYIATTAVCQEFSGILDDSPLDVFTTFSDTVYTTTHNVGPTTTTSVANELVIQAYGSGSTNPTFSAGTGYSNIAIKSGSGTFIQTAMQSKIVSSTGAQSSTLVSNINDIGDSVILTLKVGAAPTEPDPPANVKASGGDTTVTVSWNDVPGAKGYNVYKASTFGGTYTKLNTSLITNTYLLDAYLTNGSTYFYKVTAVNSIGESLQSPIVYDTPLDAPPVPTYQYHPFAVQPNLTVSQLRTANRTLYDKWFAYTREEGGMPAGMPEGALRCKVPDQGFYLNPSYNGTVSEGQGYSMYQKAQFSNPDLETGVFDPDGKDDFDGYFLYYNFFKDGHGLMHWDIRFDGTVADTGGATDGDLDAAMGLLVMHRLHGDTGTINYGAEAYKLIKAIADWEFVPATGVPGVGNYANFMTNGDGWGFGADNYMSDYFRAGFLREFSRFCEEWGDSELSQRWLDILDVNYVQALQYYYDNYLGGVVPDRQTRSHGTISADQDKATYNSVRLGFAIAYDIAWNGPDVVPQIAIDMMNKMVDRQKTLYSTGSNLKAPPWSLDGVSESGYPNGSGYGMVLPAATISATNKTFATEIFNAIDSSAEMNYFNTGVALMAMTYASGIGQPHLADTSGGQAQLLIGTTGITSSDNITQLDISPIKQLSGTTGITSTSSMNTVLPIRGIAGSTSITTSENVDVSAVRGLAGTSTISTTLSVDSDGLIGLTGSTSFNLSSTAILGSSVSIVGSTGTQFAGTATESTNVAVVGNTSTVITTTAAVASNFAISGSSGFVTVVSGSESTQTDLSGTTNTTLNSTQILALNSGLIANTSINTSFSGYVGNNQSISSIVGIRTTTNGTARLAVGLVGSNFFDVYTDTYSDYYSISYGGTYATTSVNGFINVVKSLSATSGLFTSVITTISREAGLAGISTISINDIQSLIGQLSLSGTTSISTAAVVDTSIAKPFTGVTALSTITNGNIVGSFSFTSTTAISTSVTPNVTLLLSLGASSVITTSTLSLPLITRGISGTSNLYVGSKLLDIYPEVYIDGYTPSESYILSVNYVLAGLSQLVLQLVVDMGVLRSLIAQVAIKTGVSAKLLRGIIGDIIVIFERPEVRLELELLFDYISPNSPVGQVPKANYSNKYGNEY